MVFVVTAPLVLTPVSAQEPGFGGRDDDEPKVSEHEIEFDGAGFIPNRLEIMVNDHVIFVNRSGDFVRPASNIHPTHEIYPDFDAKEGIEPSESWSFVFDRPGEWYFPNHLRPSQGGLVVVQGGDVSTASGRTELVAPEKFDFEPLSGFTLAEVHSILLDDDYLAQVIRTFGPAAVVDELSRSSEQLGIDGHQRAHYLGRLAYNEFGPSAFSLSSHECMSGSLHGATEAMLHERGTTDVSGDVNSICGGAKGRFFRHQCIHGIGHGLLGQLTICIKPWRSVQNWRTLSTASSTRTHATVESSWKTWSEGYRGQWGTSRTIFPKTPISHATYLIKSTSAPVIIIRQATSCVWSEMTFVMSRSFAPRHRTMRVSAAFPAWAGTLAPRRNSAVMTPSSQ